MSKVKKTLEAIRRYGKCAGCANAPNLDNSSVSYLGHCPPDVLVVVDAPNADGKLINDKSKVFLKKILKEGGIKKNVGIVSAFRCQIEGTGDNAARNVENCRARLRRIIAASQPSAVLFLGRVAASFLLPGTSVAEARGKKTAIYYPGSHRRQEVYAWVTHHPNYYFKTGQREAVKEAMLEDIKALVKEKND